MLILSYVDTARRVGEQRGYDALLEYIASLERASVDEEILANVRAYADRLKARLAAAAAPKPPAVIVTPPAPAAVVVAPVRRLVDTLVVEPLARTPQQINGIGNAVLKLMREQLGRDGTIYDLLEKHESATLPSWWRNTLIKGYPNLEKDADKTLEAIAKWLEQTAKPSIARWRTQYPTRVLPDLRVPSGQLGDIPGLNPKGINERAALVKAGVVDLPSMAAKGVFAMQGILKTAGVNERDAAMTIKYLSTISSLQADA